MSLRLPAFRAAPLTLALAAAAGALSAAASAAHFTQGSETAAKFGVHEIRLAAAALPPGLDPFDADVRVTFTPPAGSSAGPVTVDAFHDGDSTWAARVYVAAPGRWRWSAAAAPALGLAVAAGEFDARDSALRGRLLPHPADPAHWITEDGRWFLHLSDTAYFLFAPRDARGAPIGFADFEAYARDAHAQGITALRAFTVWGENAAWADDQVWGDAFFADPADPRLRVADFRRTDRRLAWLLDNLPDLYLQLIMLPRGSRWGADETHWHAFPARTKTRVLRYLVSRYAAFPQVYWLAVNDAHYGDNFPRNAALAREVGEYLARHDPWRHPFSTGPARTIPVPFAREPWLTYIHLEHRWDLGAAALAPYRDARKPVFLGEDYYEQDRPANNPARMAYFQRRLFWSWLFAGGSANYGGRWSSLHPYRATGRLPFAPYPKFEPDYTAPLAGLDSLPALRRWFETTAVDLAAFVPDPGLVAVPGGTTPAGRPRLLRRGGSEFLVYHPHAAADGKAAAPRPDVPARLTLDLRAVVGRFRVEWFDPAVGRSAPGAPVAAGAVVEFAAPWSGVDVVLRLTAAGP